MLINFHFLVPENFHTKFGSEWLIGELIVYPWSGVRRRPSSVTPIYGKNPSKIFSETGWCDFHETWYVASGAPAFGSGELKNQGRKARYAMLKCSVPQWHYANMPIQYAVIFKGCKNDNPLMKTLDIFLIFAQNIDCGYPSNAYPQSMS